MKKKIIGIFVCMLLIGISTVAVADWDEGDGHKMHWPQLPDPNGWDVYCTSWSPQYPNVILADDWECSETGYIKDIHFWGSWLGDNIGQIDYFFIGIAENIPPEQNPHGDWSMPGETLIEWDIYDWIERGPYTGNQGWYWSYENTNQWHPNDHQLYWQYNVFLDEQDWFWQEEGTIYWLYITAIVFEQPPDQPLWGWKSTLEDLHFMDDAVWAYVYEYFWLPLTYPTGLTMDLAFVITGGPPPVPNLDCDGDLTWTGVTPGATVSDSFNVSNIGDPLSELDWNITEWPTWGIWSFVPSSGNALKPEDGPVTVQVTVVAPEMVPRVLPHPRDTTYTGQVKIVNLDDPSDFCTIDVSLTTPKNRAFNIFPPFLRFLENHPHMFPILRHMLGL